MDTAMRAMPGRQTLTRRNRAYLACDCCKSKKAKCDGGRPSCDRCVSLKVSCVYTLNERDKRIAHRNGRIARAVERSKGLQSRDSHASANSGDDLIDSGGDNTLSVTIEPPDQVQVQAIDMHSTSPTASQSRAKPEISLSESVPDILATNAFDQIPAGEIGYFGSSTNHAMFGSLSTTLANLGIKEPRLQHSLASNTSVSQTANAAKDSLCPQSRPDAIAANVAARPESNTELVARFFDTVGNVLPYVDERAAVAKAVTIDLETVGQDPATQSWQALLNLMIAYALHTMDGSSPEPYYQRALHLLYGLAVHLSTIQTMQAQLLLSSFEQNIRRSMASLSSHALAVKTAYHLGLHAPSTYVYLAFSEKRLRARLWFAVVNQDRVLSAALGRPCLIPATHVRPEIDSMLQAGPSGAIDAETLSNTSALYFSRLVSLHKITGSALDKLFLSNVGSFRELSKDKLYCETTSLLAELDTWIHTTQCFPIFRSGSGFGDWSPSSSSAADLAIVLSLHYHRVALLIHGALLMHVLESIAAPSEDSLLHGFSGDMTILCLRRGMTAARDLHAVLAYALKRKCGFFERNATWWVCNYAAFTLSLHVFGLWVLSNNKAILSLGGLGRSTSEIESLLTKALQNLRQVGGQSMLSTKAYQRLRSLFNMFQQKTRTDELQQSYQVSPHGPGWIDQLSMGTDLNYSVSSLGEFSGSSSLNAAEHPYQFGFSMSNLDYDLGVYDIASMTGK